jgi:uncharacterized metal-binding protein YceD (DUF177 family)
MKVHIHQIPAEGLHLEGEESSRMLDLHDDSIHPAGDIHYALDVGLSDGGLFATGRLSLDLDMECVACLDHFRYPLTVPDFACQVELTGRETVDLTEAVREDILLALPPHPHCDWNGERVCQGALSRLKTEAAREALSNTRDSQETEGAKDVWGALDQLKIKKTN